MTQQVSEQPPFTIFRLWICWSLCLRGDFSGTPMGSTMWFLYDRSNDTSHLAFTFKLLNAFLVFVLFFVGLLASEINHGLVFRSSDNKILFLWADSQKSDVAWFFIASLFHPHDLLLNCCFSLTIYYKQIDYNESYHLTFRSYAIFPLLLWHFGWEWIFEHCFYLQIFCILSYCCLSWHEVFQSHLLYLSLLCSW